MSSALFHAARDGQQSYDIVRRSILEEVKRGNLEHPEYELVRPWYPCDMTTKRLFAQAAVGGHVDLMEQCTDGKRWTL